MEIKTIGVIHSEHKIKENIPIQPIYAKGCLGEVIVDKKLEKGLKDLENFSHIYLLYYLHEANETKLTFKPFLQDVDRGIFSTRSPFRPNHIGMSIVELRHIKNNVLYIDSVDILDGTPLLDIKPYTSRFDNIMTTKNGWQDEVDDKDANIKGLRGYKNSCNNKQA